jgi:hypothetical protein
MDIEDWKEIEDAEITNEVDILKIEYCNDKTYADNPVCYWYSNALLNGKPVGLVYTNESEGTASTPIYYTEGHHNKQEFLKAHLFLLANDD